MPRSSKPLSLLAAYSSTLLLICLLYAAGCGGGGGGGSDGDGSGAPAIVDLNLEPNDIDSGDFSTIKIELNDVNSAGILLKVAFPDALTYIRGSSFLSADGDDAAHFEPSIVQVASNVVYVVYFISRAHVGESNHAVLRLQVKALERLASGIVAVDADQNDPQIPDSREFDADNPNFTAVSEEDVTIDGSPPPAASGTVSGTPSASATSAGTATAGS